MRYVVINADCESVLRRILLELVEDRKHLFGRSVLAAQSKASADDYGLNVRIIECRLHVQIKRFADCAAFLCPVEDCNLFNRLRDCVQEMFDAERAI